MARTEPQTKTAHINRLPAEIFFHIIKRLPIKNKFRLKVVCKKWNTLLISDILPRQDKLLIGDIDLYPCRCVDPDHQFDFRGNNSIPLYAVLRNENVKRFIEKEVTGLKVLKYTEKRNEVIKSCLSEGSSLSLQCLDVYSLEEPLVQVLPNLQHFSANRINIVSLVSVFQYCPTLTHLSIYTTHHEDDFADTLIHLPKGMQYLNLDGTTSDCLAVLCSPAMETLESVVLENWDYETPFDIPEKIFRTPNAPLKPAPRLQRFSMVSFMNEEQGLKMIIDFMKGCSALKEIDLRVEGLTLEDYINIYSGLSNLEIICLDFKFDFDDVLHMIVQRNRESLKYLDFDARKLNLELMKKLAEFTNLQMLYFSRAVVRILVLSNF